jgi:two-component system, response regulator PdtaR
MHTAQILIVEDERIVALDLARRLRRLGYTVAGTAYSGVEAVHKAQALRPTLVLMDIGLTGAMTGLEAGEAIRAELQIPVVYVSAYRPENQPPNNQSADSPPYLQKPFDQQQLRTTLDQALNAAPREGG